MFQVRPVGGICRGVLRVVDLLLSVEVADGSRRILLALRRRPAALRHAGRHQHSAGLLGFMSLEIRFGFLFS